MTLELGDAVALPEPRQAGPLSVEAALSSRRSVRDFAKGPLTLAEVSQLLWAAQGITDPEGYRAAPSAGALYPLEVYLVAGEVAALEAGIYKYDPLRHRLTLMQLGDRRAELAAAALDQDWMADGAAVLVIAAVPERTERKYGDRANRYVPMEAGHAAENVYLQAAALGLGTTVVGAFRDAQVKAVVGMARDERPLCLLPVGRPAA
ncbi:MAG: SagB/ThcOx family dehydrogenase [Alphaproteobacteria bacterium]